MTLGCVAQIGTHVHSVVGASRFKDVYDQADLMQSNCTTIPVQPDKSNYWAVRSLLVSGRRASLMATFGYSRNSITKTSKAAS